MSLIFSAGDKRPQWGAPTPKKLIKTAQLDGGIHEETTMDEGDPMLDAVKNVPGIGGLDVQVSEEPVLPGEAPAIGGGGLEDVPIATDPLSPEVPGLPTETSPAGAVGEVPATTEEAALKEVKIKMEEAQLAVAKLEEAVTKCEKDGGPSPAGDVPVVDEVEVELEDEGGIPGVKDESAPPFESKPEGEKPEGEKPKDDKPKGEKKPSAEPEKKTEKEGESGGGEKQEKESCTAKTSPVFIRVAKLSSKNRSDLREYWIGLGMPSEYVDAMVKDYED